MRPKIGPTAVGLLVSVVVAAAGTPAFAQADRAAALRQRLTEAGYGEGEEAVQNALKSTDPGAQGIALRIALLTRDAAAIDGARELLGSPSLRVRFEAALLLNAMGERGGLEVLDDIAGATRKVLDEQDDVQLVVIDAAEWFALNGYDGYVYQLSLMLDGGRWPNKLEAARALGSFQSMSDPCQEQAWLVGLDIVRIALEESKPEIDAWAGQVLAELMRGLSRQPEITPAVHEALSAFAEKALRTEVGVTAGAIKALSESLKPRLVRAPQLPCAPLDPDPREVGARAVLSLVSFLNRGIYDSFQRDLDINGEFEGLSRKEWIEKLQREFKAPENAATQRFNVMPRTVRQPAAGTVVVEAEIDVLNDVERRWDRFDYTFVVEWFGFDWHFTRIDVRAWPEDRQPDRDPVRATPPADGPHAEAGALADTLMKALAEGDVTTLRRILSPDGIFMGNLTRTELIIQLEQNWVASAPSDFRITPTEFRFRGEPDAPIVEIDSFNRGLLTPARVRANYTAFAERDPETGALRISRLDISSTRLP